MTPTKRQREYNWMKLERDIWRFLACASIFAWILFGASKLLSGEVSTPRDAITEALADCSRLDPADQPFARYFWLPRGSKAEAIAFRYMLNASLSSAISTRAGRRVSDHLYAVDLRDILPDPTDRARVLGVLEEHVDPYFHVVRSLQSIDVGQFVFALRPCSLRSGTSTVCQVRRGRVACVTDVSGPYVKVSIDGRAGWLLAKEVAVVSFGLHVLPHPALDQPERIADANLLATLTFSRCPIFTLPHFLPLALNTVDGAYYYRLIGVEGLNLNQALARFGVDADDFNNPATTNRTAVFVSRVTGKPRAGKFGFAATRPTETSGLWTATEDIADDDLDPNQHAIYNLRGAKFTAGEGVFLRQNGMLAGLAYNAAGELQDEVTPNVARDSQSTPPHHARVNGWFTCFRCHANDGYQDFANDVQAIVRAGGDVFGDTSAPTDDAFQIVDELRGQYMGDLSRPLNEARRAHAAVVYRACGAPYEEVYKAVVGVYEGYEYAWVTPQVALLDLGHVVEDDKALDLFNRVVPKLPLNDFGFSPDDPTILGIRAWKPAAENRPAGPEIRRRDWERVLGDAALRAMLSQPQLDKGAK